MITATLLLDDGQASQEASPGAATRSYELGDRKVPPTYIIHQGDLYAVQPWKLPTVWGDDIAAAYCRIHSLDVTQWLPLQKRASA